MYAARFTRAISRSSRPRTAARSDVLPHHLDEVRVLSEEDARRAVEHGEHGEVALLLSVVVLGIGIGVGVG